MNDKELMYKALENYRLQKYAPTGKSKRKTNAMLAEELFNENGFAICRYLGIDPDAKRIVKLKKVNRRHVYIPII